MYRGVTRFVVALNQKGNQPFFTIKVLYHIYYFIAAKFAAFFECNYPCSIIGAQANFIMHVQSYAKTNKPYLWKSSTIANPLIETWEIGQASSAWEVASQNWKSCRQQRLVPWHLQ